MEHAQSFAYFALFVVLAVGGTVWTFVRSASLINMWAASEDLEVLARKYCWFWTGPFFLNCSRNQTVYRVTVRSRDGSVQSAWIRCGSWWGGLMSDEVDVRWD